MIKPTLKIPLSPVQKYATKRSFAALALFGIASIGFIGLAKEVRDAETIAVDENILRYIHHTVGGTFDPLVVFVTNTSGPLAIILFTIVLCTIFLYRDKQSWALKLMLGVGGASLIGLILKNIFSRVRPTLWDRIVTETTFSFPSGHAIASSALAASLVFALWRTKWRYHSLFFGIMYVLVIGFTRLYLGVHYPSDIIAGWFVSIGWVALVWLIFTKTNAQHKAGKLPVKHSD